MTSPRRVDEALLRSRPLPHTDDEVDKNTRGRVLVAGGSRVSPGAVMLGGLAALRAGAGKAALALPEPLAIPVAVAFPEAGVHGYSATPEGTPLLPAAAETISGLLRKVDAALVGPGLMDEATAQALAGQLLETVQETGLVLDALALTGLWSTPGLLARHEGNVVLTPHPGEMAALTGLSKEAVCDDPLRVARQAAEHLCCIVVLKGATTIIAAPGEVPFVHEGGSVGLATSGSGDVLAGILVSLMAQGAPAIDAAIWSVFLHGQAGRRLADRIGEVGFLARELPAEIPALLQALRS